MIRNESEILGGLSGVAIILRARRDVEMAEAVERAEAYIRNLPADATCREELGRLREALASLVSRIEDAWPELGNLPPMIAARAALQERRT